MHWRERHLPQGSPQRRPYRQPNSVTVNSILIEQWLNVHGFDVVLYTRIGANISPTPAHLASLAIASAKQGAGEQEILRQTGTKTLKEVWQYCRMGNAK